jgi:hypothetical protein
MWCSRLRDILRLFADAKPLDSEHEGHDQPGGIKLIRLLERSRVVSAVKHLCTTPSLEHDILPKREQSTRNSSCDWQPLVRESQTVSPQTLGRCDCCERRDVSSAKATRRSHPGKMVSSNRQRRNGQKKEKYSPIICC